jgi:hypothetical protein
MARQITPTERSQNAASGAPFQDSAPSEALET